MKAITLEWIDKAEGDRFSAQREVRARKNPNYDAACFHSQQCAEKYLKARLQEGGIAFKKPHDLVNLLNLVLSVIDPRSVVDRRLASLRIPRPNRHLNCSYSDLLRLDPSAATMPRCRKRSAEAD